METIWPFFDCQIFYAKNRTHQLLVPSFLYKSKSFDWYLKKVEPVIKEKNSLNLVTNQYH